MKLVRYVGAADSRVIKSSEFAEAGLVGIGDMRFAKDSETDFYRSVSDLVAIFLLSQGDFVCEDGSTIFDIFQNAVTSGTAEVLSVNEMDGEVVLPGYGSDASAGTAALRKLGRAAGKALAGDDPLIADAITKTLFGEDNNVVLVKNSSGEYVPVQLASSTVLGRKATGEVVAMTASDVYGLISGLFGGLDGLELDDLLNVSAPGLNSGGYVLGTTDGINWTPVVVGDLSAPDGIVRTDVALVFGGALDGAIDLTTEAARKASSVVAQITDDDGVLTIKLPEASDSDIFFLNCSFTAARSGGFEIANDSGDDFLISDPFDLMKTQEDRLLLMFVPTKFVGVNSFGLTWMVVVIPEGSVDDYLAVEEVSDFSGYAAYLDRGRVFIDGALIPDAGVSTDIGDPLPTRFRPSEDKWFIVLGQNDMLGTPETTYFFVSIDHTTGVISAAALDPGVTMTGQVGISMAGCSFRK